MNDLPQPMRTVWHSLLWKEWHEHKWKLASLTAIMVAALCVFSLSGLDIYMLLVTTQILLCYCVLVGTFLGMSTAGRERGRNTLPFLQSLPVPMWQPGATKLAVAALTAALPLLALVATFCIWCAFHWFGGTDLSDLDVHGMSLRSRPWGISNWLVATTVSFVLGVTSLLLWMAAMSVNRSDEIRSGAVGFLIVCLVWFVLAFGLVQAEKRDLPTLRDAVEILFAAAPGGAAFVGVGFGPQGDLVLWPDFLPYFFSAVLGHGCLLFWYLRRFGKVIPGSSRTDGKTLALAAGGYQHLAPPKRSQLRAVAWKQIRETGPLALLAIVAILGISTAAWWANSRYRGTEEFGEILGGTTLSVCFFVTLVTGIGVFLEDFKPRVDDFWRSRPVNYELWFAVKFVVGAVILVGTFGTLMLLAHWLTEGRLLIQERHPELVVGFISFIFLLIYTLSMASYCVMRQPLYAAILTIGLLIGGMFAIQWIYDYFDISSGKAGFAILLFVQVAATALAWQAVKRNWSWGNR